MSDGAEFKLSLPEPSEEQFIALRGLATAFGWKIEEICNDSNEIMHATDGPCEDQPHLKSDGDHYVLKDESDSVLETDTENYRSRQQLRSQVIEKSQEIINPYNSLFDTKLPGVDKNSKVFGLMQVGRSFPVSWTFEQASTTPPLIYYYKMLYAQGKSTNRVLKASIDIRTEKEDAKGYMQNCSVTPNLNFTFDDQSNIDGLSLSSGQNGKDVLRRITAGSPLSQMFARLGFLQGKADDMFEDKSVVYDIKHGPYAMAWSIGIDVSKGVLTHKLGVVGRERPNGLPNLSSEAFVVEYRLIDAQDGTIRPFTTYEGDRTDLVQPITIKEYLSVIKGMLDLVPVN